MMEIRIVVMLIMFLPQTVLSTSRQTDMWTERQQRSSNCSIHYISGESYINCSNRNLTVVPTLPRNSVYVDLSNNQIKTISSTPFVNMTLLRWLNLSYNPLQFVSENLFTGLNKLTHLFIRRSQLYKHSSLNINTLLHDLNILTHLAFTFSYVKNDSLEENTCQYGTLPILYKIETLEIDSSLLQMPVSRDDLMQAESMSVKNLIIRNGQFCFKSMFTKDDFIGMPSLISLAIYYESGRLSVMKSVSNDSFSSLTYLSDIFIDYGNNKHMCVVGHKNIIDFLSNVSTSVNNLSNLKTFKMEHFSCSDKFEINSFAFRGLSFSNSLEKFSLQNNTFSNSDYDIWFWPQTLKSIQLQQNCFTHKQLYTIYKLSTHIQEINAQYQNACGKSTNQQNKKFHRYRSTSIKPHGRREEFQLRKLVLTYSLASLYLVEEERLEYRHLTYLDLSWNKDLYGKTISLPDIFSSQRPNLQYLNMAGSQIANIDRNALYNLTSLMYLNLSSNYLGNMGCILSDRFGSLGALQQLDLSNNGIECISSSMFKSLKYLLTLDLSKNRILNFTVSIQPLEKLQFLNLSNNQIEILNSVTRKELDTIAEMAPLSVDLSGNRLSCDCRESLKFLNWMQRTKVNLLNINNYVCSFSNASETTLRNLDSVISSLTSTCASNMVIIISCSVAFTFFLAVLVTGLSYRHRWRLRYIYYMSKLKVRKRKPGYEDLYAFGAFVSYSSADYEIARHDSIERLENKENINLCIHERDFQPGQSIALNISKGIHESKVTLLFISKDFLISEWCLYELNIARMESLHRNKSVILVVMLEDIPSSDLPLEVIDIIRTYTYLEYPKTNLPSDIDIFWKKCADFINDI